MRKVIANDRNFYQKDFYIKIRNLFKSNKYNAFIKEANEYLSLFPNDTHVRFMRAKVYRYLNRFDECIEDLKYNLNFDVQGHTLTELFYVYYYLNMYQEVLELLPELYERKNIQPYSLSIAELVMKKQLGLEVNVKKGARCDYIKEQILDYNEDVVLRHIMEHKDNKEEKCRFNDNINLNYLFDLIRNNIDNTKKVNTEEILEIHYFGISNIGYIENNICNFIKVVVIPNTNKIISMYPTDEVDSNHITNIEIDYDKLLMRENKVKTLSMIDKFNKKYNIN